MRELGCLCSVMKIQRATTKKGPELPPKMGTLPQAGDIHYVMTTAPHYHKKLYNHRQSAKALAMSRAQWREAGCNACRFRRAEAWH